MNTTDISNSSLLTNSYEQQSYQKILSGNIRKGSEAEKTIASTKEFEAYFISYMFKEMRKTIPDGGLLPKNDGEKIFEEMLDQNYARKMADRGGIGLTRIMLEHMQANKGEKI